MTSAPPNPRHKRGRIKLSREFSRRIYAIARPLNLSLNDVLILIGSGAIADKDRHARGTDTEASSPGGTPPQSSS